MPTSVHIPVDLWAEDWATGAMLDWLVSDGAEVRAGEPLADVLVDKVTLELEAPATGVLRIRCAANAVVNRGEKVAEIL